MAVANLKTPNDDEKIVRVGNDCTLKSIQEVLLPLLELQRCFNVDGCQDMGSANHRATWNWSETTTFHRDSSRVREYNIDMPELLCLG